MKHSKRAIAVESAKFLAAWALVFAAIYFGLSLVVGFQLFEEFAANSASVLLNLFGEKASVALEEGNVFLLVQGERAWISELCSGLFEVALIVGAIAASFGIGWRKRLAGFAGAIVVGFGFNVLRIFVSVMQVMHTSAAKAEFSHDLLFRISIIVVVALYYYFWLKLAKRN